MKKYGIYLAYPPTIDLRAEGLGRHLAEFLKGAQARGDIKFVIACPSWMTKSLLELFEASGIHHDSFEIVAPTKVPALLRLYEIYQSLTSRPKRKGRLGVVLEYWRLKVVAPLKTHMAKSLVGSRSIFSLLLAGMVVIPIALILTLCHLFKKLATFIGLIVLKAGYDLARRARAVGHLHRLSSVTAQPKNDALVSQLYRLLEASEIPLMHRLIDARDDVSAWYCPTAFWPHFNQIKAPRLICVPDVVLSDFPVGFAPLGGERFFDNFKQVETAIAHGQHFVTYSEDVKWRTLVQRYHVESDAIDVIRHGANRLDDLVSVQGFADNETATNVLCRNIFKGALSKAVNIGGAIHYGSENLRFIFYASQFRPNKNVLSLLRAYVYLLKKRYLGHKLVLTGNPNALPEIAEFIKNNNLENDVLFLHRLSSRELAACYRLADLAVNPSLSEGGCPFTFTEGLSVGTPVVMARIPVTEEVITDSALQQHMLFDPYDWKNMAEKIEWALNNHDALLSMQKPVYDQLAQRTWRHVVDECVEILDRISVIK